MDGQTDGRMDGPTDQLIDMKWPIESRVRSLNVRGLKIRNIHTSLDTPQRESEYPFFLTVSFVFRNMAIAKIYMFQPLA